MIALVVRVLATLALVVRAHAVYPNANPGALVRASWEAVGHATDETSAELLLAIAEHESDLQPCAVSYVANGTRHDMVAPGCEVSATYPLPVVAGYLQATFHDRAAARDAMRLDGAMAEGVRQLAECAADCARWGMHDESCMLREYAGGVACALDARACKPEQRAFVWLFTSRAAAMSGNGE